MIITPAEKLALIAQYRDKAWAHILRLEMQRGRKLVSYQIKCISAALGVDLSAR